MSLFFWLGALALPIEGLGRTFEILGVKLDASPRLRVLADESEHRNQYRSLRLYEVNLDQRRNLQKHWLVSRSLAKKRQRYGLFDVHRSELRRRKLLAIDDAEAHGFAQLIPLEYEDVNPSRLLSPGEAIDAYTWHCTLKERGEFKGQLRFEVGSKSTVILLHESETGTAHKIIELPHRSIKSRRMGQLSSPASILSGAYLVPGTKTLVFILSYVQPSGTRGPEHQVLIWARLGKTGSRTLIRNDAP